jgi:hypothetical protein
MYKPKVGDKVTCVTSVEADYSDYGGQPEQWFKPGMVGTVLSVNNPSVWRERVVFHNIAFTGDNGKTWRVGLLKSNVVLIKE